jgi:hypothetical protein
MSRGLGIMQRRILDALVARPGGDRVDERHVASFGLAPGVHDLRKVSRALASEYAAMSCANYATGKWQASFSRAVAGLVARGYLKVPSLVPIAALASAYAAFQRQAGRPATAAYRRGCGPAPPRCDSARRPSRCPRRARRYPRRCRSSPRDASSSRDQRLQPAGHTKRRAGRRDRACSASGRPMAAGRIEAERRGSCS